MSTPKQHHEASTRQPSHEHVARRDVRQRAVVNTTAAIAYQFPALFVAPLAKHAITQTQKGDDDHASTAQTA